MQLINNSMPYRFFNSTTKKEKEYHRFEWRRKNKKKDTVRHDKGTDRYRITNGTRNRDGESRRTQTGREIGIERVVKRIKRVVEVVFVAVGGAFCVLELQSYLNN